MQFSAVLVALLATSSLAAPAPLPAANAAAPVAKPPPKTTNPDDPTNPTSQDPTVHDNTPDDPNSQTPTVPDSQTPTVPSDPQPENSGTTEPAPESSGTPPPAPACNAKRDLSNLFGLLKRACGATIIMPPGGQAPKTPGQVRPYVAPRDAELQQYLADAKNYVFGDVNNPVNVRMRNVNKRYINRIAGDGDVQLYAGDGKKGAMVQTEDGNRLNVGQAYQNYDEGFFDPKQEPMKSILASNDPEVIQKFFASTSADFVLSAEMPLVNNQPDGTVVLSTSFTNDQLKTMTGAMGFHLIFTSDENPAAISHPSVRFMTRVDPAVAEIFLQETAPALAVVLNPDLASAKVAESTGWVKGSDGKIYRKMAQGWMPVEVLWDKTGEFGPKPADW